MELILIPTLKCEYNCDYCYINNNQFDRKKEIEYSNKLTNILNLFDTISLSGGEPLLYSEIEKLITNHKNIKTISSSFYVDDNIIEKILDINCDINFHVTYQGLSGHRRPFNSNIKKKIYKYINNINYFYYVFFIKNFKNVMKDLEELKSLNKNIEYIFYYEKSDISYIESLSINEKNELKNIINLIFNKDIFIKKDLFNKKNILYLGPFNTNIYFSRQNIDRDNCKDCFPTTMEHDTCQNCISYQENNPMFSLDLKDNYISSFENLKNILKIGEISEKK